MLPLMLSSGAIAQFLKYVLDEAHIFLFFLFDILPGQRKCVTLKESGSLAAIV